MCSACVFDSFSMAALMAVMPPSTRIDSVEKLVCAPVPARTHVFAFLMFPNTFAYRSTHLMLDQVRGYKVYDV